jgi:phospholipid/cholesterol/gamma-HCH transport system ATP-binding protein
MTPALALHALTVRGPTGVGASGVELALGPGEAVVLSGPVEASSAVLRAAMGVERPEAGAVRLLGEDLRRLRRRKAEALLARVGYQPSSGALVSNMLLRDNLLLPLRYHRRLDGPAALEIARRAAARFGIDELPALLPSLASLALRRRVALARAAILDPELLVLDDPTEDLDGTEAAALAGRIAAVARQLGAAVLAASNDPHVAAALGARVVPLDLPSAP